MLNPTNQSKHRIMIQKEKKREKKRKKKAQAHHSQKLRISKKKNRHLEALEEEKEMKESLREVQVLIGI